MNVTSVTRPQWVVSTRTRGELLTAGARGEGLELLLLGVPTGYTSPEVSGWLQDLIGVARETSRGDEGVRPIPALLHHALTGLLFSHGELWRGAPDRGPCSAAFVETEQGIAFGWLGAARVRVLLDGDPVEPQWVRVRDEEGREARAMVIDPARQMLISLEWWAGEDETQSPTAVAEAEWSAEATPAAATSATAVAAPVTPAPVRAPDAPVVVVSQLPLPSSLPTSQPGLASAPYEAMTESVAHAAEVEAPPAASHSIPAAEPWSDSTPVPDDSQGDRHGGIKRWLGKLIGWTGRREVLPNAPDDFAPGAAASPREPDPTPASTVPPPHVAPAVAREPQSPAPPKLFVLQDTIAIEPVAGAPPVAEPPTPAEIDPIAEALEAVRQTKQPPSSIAARWSNLGSELAAATPKPQSLPAAKTPTAKAKAAGELTAPAFTPMPEVDPIVIDSRAAIEPQTNAEPEASTLIPPAPSTPIADVPPSTDVTPAERIAPAAPTSIPVAPAVAAIPFPRRNDPPQAAPPVLRTPSRTPPAATPVEPSNVPVSAYDALLSPGSAAPPSPPAPPVAATPPPSEPMIEAQAAPAPVAAAPARSAPVAPPLVPPVELAGFETAAPPLEQEVPFDPPFLEPNLGRVPTSRAAWPTPAEFERDERPLWKRHAKWGIVLGVALIAGLVIGSLQMGGKQHEGRSWLSAIGLGGAHFQSSITSDPAGAWIAVDGKDVAKRTPATIELTPGEHKVKLTLPDLGAAEFTVRGMRNEKVPLNAPLAGSLEVYSSDSATPISVSLDGQPHGFAPLTIESLAPGLHELQFSGPGVQAWAQTVQIGVRQSAQVVAQPVRSPSTGVLQVQARMNDEEGQGELKGATVWVDGELQGSTPLTLELQRGPHSLRVQYHGELAPVQVIDLPGGNQRFATFDFGLGIDSPQLVPLSASRTYPSDRAGVVSAGVDGLAPGDLREAWLHVRSAEGLWRRYPMTVLKSPLGSVLVSVFPNGVFDSNGQTRYYMSGITRQGDEFFTEIQSAQQGAPVGKARQPS